VTTERESVRRLLHVLTTVGATLVLLVIVSSAYLRLTHAGLSCIDWPACYGRVDADASVTAGPRIARLAHRVAATAVAAIFLALALITWTQRPVKARHGMITLACLLIVAGLAVLGVATPGTRLPAVTVANFGGGYALLGLLWWLRLTVVRPPLAITGAPVWVNIVAALGLLALIVQIALGGMVAAKFAALACPAFPGCGADWPDGSLAASIDLFQPLLIGSDGTIARPAALAALHWTHRVGAVIVVASVALVATHLVPANTHGRRLALYLGGLVVAQVTLGAAAVLTGLALPLVLAHNLVAALLVIALVTLNCRISAGKSSPSAY
jgi:heme a synthase